MKTFLYLRGNPATGKITVARILEKELSWKLFWFHDLKNAIYNIVQEHRIPRLMDSVTVPVARFLMEQGENVIYVRPSPDKETVEQMQNEVAKMPDYQFVVVQLQASYEDLLQRVEKRGEEYRISSKEDLDAYLATREVAAIEGEHIIQTTNRTPESVAKEIKQYIQV